MNSRWTGPALAVIAAITLVLAAWSSRWLVAELRTADLNASIRIGLLSLKVCVATEFGSHCQSAAWSDIPGAGDVGTWVWLCRITFILCVAAAIALVLVAGLSIADIELRGALSLPWATQTACQVLMPLMAGVYLLSPSALRGLEAGRGFAFGFVGAAMGAVAAWHQRPRE